MGRDSGDWDIWLSPDEPNYWSKELLGEGSKNWDVCIMPEEIMDKFDIYSKATGCASEDDMLTIKMSHLPWDIFWWKHAQDALYLKSRDAVVNEPLYEALKEYWKIEHGTKTQLSLYRTKDEFFNDHVVKYFEHDYLHELLAVNGVPVYSKCLKDGQQVLICKDKFDSLPFPEKIRMFKEEIGVIALERWIIPKLMKGTLVSIGESWNSALHKTVVDLTKGWASYFIIENLTEFVKPLREDMLVVLDKINLKEKYMRTYITKEELFELVAKDMKIEDITCRWFKSSHDRENYETDLEYIVAYLDADGFTEFLHSGDHVIEQVGGGEGGGESCYSIIKAGDKFFKVTYSYYSHYGFETDDADIFEVTPQEKLVTVYE